MPTLEKAKEHAEDEDEFPEKEKKTPGIDASQRYHLHTTISMATLEKLRALEPMHGNFGKIIDAAVEKLATWENLPPVDKKIWILFPYGI